MTIEAATYISTLSPSAPASGDPRSQGDDHLRLLKQVLQNTFPNAQTPFYFPQAIAEISADYAVSAPADGGGVFPINCASTTRTVTLPNTGLLDGFRIIVLKSEFSINALTISGNGKTINGKATAVLKKGYQWAVLTYHSQLAAWLAQIPPMPETGSFLDSVANSVDGFIMADGISTIGNASSAATVSATYTQALFSLLWTQFSNTICPVSGGRGATASADYAANKRITMPDLRGRARFGRDDMGGSAANRITASSSAAIAGNTLGASGGSQTVTLVQSDLPPVSVSFSGTISGTTDSQGAHTHVFRFLLNSNEASTSGNPTTGGGGTFNSNDFATDPSGSHTHAVGGTCSGSTSALNGGVTQTAVGNMPPCFITNTFIAF